MGSPEQALNVDFAALAVNDEDFAKIYRKNAGYVDFQDPETVQQLTKSILNRDFNLKIELPSDRLCPPVPVRYEYVKWLQDLMDTTSEDLDDVYDPDRVVCGIDIGVGSSCIYPLLACASRPAWIMAGTELDDKSFEHATKNVVLNDFKSRIRLRKTEASNKLLDLNLLGIKGADFVMCNPPFFTSRQDMLATHETKKRSPSAICTGAEVEMVTEGGDLGFVTRLIEESTNVADRVQWFSSMLGKLASVHAVVAKLKEKDITNWAVTALQAGNVTKRWVVAWSYGDMRPRNDVARGRLITTKEILPFPTSFIINVSELSPDMAAARLNEMMRNLELSWEWDSGRSTGLAYAKSNVWSRSARRKRQQWKDSTTPDQSEESDADIDNAALCVRIMFMKSVNEFTVRWLKGSDSVLLESFCGMLKRGLTSPA